jgi:lysozyme
MSSILPPHRPLQNLAETRELLGKHVAPDAVALLGRRGYYRRTMGDPAVNDRGIYDDAIFLVSPSTFAAFNANTDPSVFRKHVATLSPGLWWYKVGIHGLSKPKEKRYTALVQAAEVKVLRDGEPSETGFFGINIHRGARASTSSIGCQTIWPDQWPQFIATVQAELKRHGQKTIPYLLLSE